MSYLAEGRRALGVIPSQDTLVLERFFDESGGMQLVLHAPFGSRINKAWGLALRKRFCRQFNFELQAAATEDALMLSLGPQHSFPLSDVFRYLHPETTRDVLVQAFLDAPVFKTRWRWNTTISLAVPRAQRRAQGGAADPADAGGRPDGGGVPRRRRLPREHPRRSADSRSSARLTDRARLPRRGDGLRRASRRARAGSTAASCGSSRATRRSRRSSRTRSSTPGRTRFSTMRRSRSGGATRCSRGGPPIPRRPAISARSTPDAIARVREEERPDPRDADELHDALLTAGFLTGGELDGVRPELLAELTAARRAGSADFGGSTPDARRIIVAAERLPELRAIHPDLVVPPSLQPPASRLAKSWTRGEAIAEILRGRLTLTGPVTAAALADSLGISPADADAALLLLEADGVVLRGRFTPGETDARMVRSDAARPHSSLHAEPAARRDRAGQPGGLHALPLPLAARRDLVQADGLDGLREIVAALDGYELAAGAWERAVLPARLDRYDPSMLDMLCLAGEAGWARLSPAARPGRPGAQPRAGDADRALPARACGCVADAADNRRGTAARTRRLDASCRCSARAERRSSRDLAPACGLDADQLRHAHRARWSPAGWRRRMDSPDCARSCGRRADGRRARSAQQLRRPVDGQSRRAAKASRASEAVELQALDAAPPLRRRVPAAAHARDERRDLARARARVPASRGARRDPQRPVRDRHVGRAVRASGRRRAAARGSAHPGGRLASSPSARPIR